MVHLPEDSHACFPQDSGRENQGKGLRQTSLSDSKIDPLLVTKQSFQSAKLETLTPDLKALNP